MATTQIVSWSEISSYRDCPHKHQLAYIDRWETPEIGPALAKGISWHQVLEQHYLAIRAVQDTGEVDAARPHHESITELLGTKDPQQTEQQQLIEWMYWGYLQRWPIEEEIRSWRILGVEHAAEVWLPTPRGGRSRFRLKMKLDLIVRIGRRIWVVDHKSGKDLPKEKELELDDQFGLYCWGLRQLGHPVHGALYNAARTLKYKDESQPQPLDERFGRILLYRTDAELDTIAREAYATATKAWGAHGSHERTPDTGQCGWKCGFMEACLASRKGQDERRLLIAKGYQQNRTRH